MSANSELARIFKTMAAILEIKGEPVFKAIAFSKIGRAIADAPFDLSDALKNNTLDQIKGIGPSSHKIITEYLTTGRSGAYDELFASIPPTLIEMLRVPGLGPKTIGLVWKERNVTTIDELLKAIDDGKLNDLKGIGEKKLNQIRQGIELRQQAGHRAGIGEAMATASILLTRIRALPGVSKVEIAGSLRRRRETVGDIDFVCAIDQKIDGAQITDAFTKFPEATTILANGPTKASIITAGGLQADLRVVPAENFGAALLYFTGSQDHNIAIRGRAQDQGMTLNEWGLYDLKTCEKRSKKTSGPPNVSPLASKSEAEIYTKLGLEFIEPEIRENRGEVELAARNSLPKLIELSDYKGDLHCHTNASDGIATIEQMAEAAIARGYSYIAITDHSKAQAIANGLSVERLLAHVKMIQKVSDKLKGIMLLTGAEVDILSDGRLDYEDSVLAELDFVVASPHISLSQDSSKATDRLVRAIENRYTCVIGHPTGRLINRRAGLSPDMQRVFKAAAQTGTALEINASYPRLDLSDVNARGAIDAGAMLSINTDAHATSEFDEISAGISVARRAWATKANVINCLTIEKLRAFISKKRK